MIIQTQKSHETLIKQNKTKQNKTKTGRIISAEKLIIQFYAIE